MNKLVNELVSIRLLSEKIISKSSEPDTNMYTEMQLILK